MITRPPTPTLFPYTTLFRSMAFTHLTTSVIAINTFVLMTKHYPQSEAWGQAQEGINWICTVFYIIEILITLVGLGLDRKSTRLNSSHANISYAVFCLKKKK